VKEEFKIRLADLSDLQRVLSILDNAAKWLFEIGIKNQWLPGEVFEYQDYYLDAIKNKELYVAKKDHKVIATFLLRGSDKDIWKDETVDAAYIHHLAIDRNTSISGFGGKLLAWAETYVKSEGKKKIRLDCIQSNKKLNDYYLSKAYKFKGEFKYYDDDLGNLYEKIL